MEILNFYWANIIAACFLSYTLAVYGQHVMARNKSIEVMLLGQELQTSILIAAWGLSYFNFSNHDDHMFHEESLISLVIALIFHSSLTYFFKKQKNYRVELTLVFIVLLVSINHLLVSLNPIVEMHMSASMLGDLVTVSKAEALIATGISICLLIYFKRNEEHILQDTIEISIFSKNNINPKKILVFSILVLTLMFISVHLFGLYFTLANLLIPPLFFNFSQLERKFYHKINLIIPILLILSFYMIVLSDKIPTTIIFVLLLALFYSAVFIQQFRKNKN